MTDPEPQATGRPPQAVPVAAPVQPDPTQEDLYCIECGYNLRGIAGDPRRCPECWQVNSVADMRIPAQLIHKQARKLETLPTICVAWVFVLPFVLGIVASPMVGKALGAAGVIGTLVGWGLCVYCYAKSCEFSPGWPVALLEMHLAGVLMFSPLVLSVLSLIQVSRGLGAMAAAALVTGIVFGVAGGLIYRDARRRLVQVRRSAAVMLAKRELTGCRG